MKYARRHNLLRMTAGRDFPEPRTRLAPMNRNALLPPLLHKLVEERAGERRLPVGGASWHHHHWAERTPLPVPLPAARGEGIVRAAKESVHSPVPLPAARGEGIGKSHCGGIKMNRSTAVFAALAAAVWFPAVCFAQTPPPAGPGNAGRPAASARNRGGFGGGEPSGPADQASPRTDLNSQRAHAQLLEKARKGGIDIYFEGDSITRRWGTSDPQYRELLANWNSNFFGWNAADFGWGGDKIENILWRLENGELDGVNPKIIVVLAGINNVGARPGDDAKVADITQGLRAILDVCRKKAPGATVIMTGIFPRNDNMGVVSEINRINANIAQFADGKTVRYLNVNDKLADKDGQLFPGMMNAADKLHPTVKGYQVWADALKPIFTELLGPPAKTDHAPPPTGDPSASTSPARRLNPLSSLLHENEATRLQTSCAITGKAGPRFARPDDSGGEGGANDVSVAGKINEAPGRRGQF